MPRTFNVIINSAGDEVEVEADTVETDTTNHRLSFTLSGVKVAEFSSVVVGWYETK